VILGTGFTHILPDAVDAWGEYYASVGKDQDSLYPMAYAVALGCFLFLWAVDRIWGHSGGGEHGHSHGGGGGDHGHAHGSGKDQLDSKHNGSYNTTDVSAGSGRRGVRDSGKRHPPSTAFAFVCDCMGGIVLFCDRCDFAESGHSPQTGE
jgi:hypothetical protein